MITPPHGSPVCLGLCQCSLKVSVSVFHPSTWLNHQILPLHCRLLSPPVMRLSLHHYLVALSGESFGTTLRMIKPTVRVYMSDWSYSESWRSWWSIKRGLWSSCGRQVLNELKAARDYVIFKYRLLPLSYEDFPLKDSITVTLAVYLCWVTSLICLLLLCLFFFGQWLLGTEQGDLYIKLFIIGSTNVPNSNVENADFKVSC